MYPNLTVIIPVFNGIPFLKDAVESILCQTHKDFILLIIDDGSTDYSLNYLKGLSDPRIKIKHQKNLGLCNTLNNAVAEIDTDFVARLDQDDISFPNRLEEQWHVLLSNKEYSCVVSQITRIGASGKEFGYYKRDSINSIIDYDPKYHGSIAHSTICFRRDKFIQVGGYRDAFYPVDDLDLLLRFWELGKVAVINKPLVKYRVHRKAASFSLFRDMQQKTRYAYKMLDFRISGKPEVSIDLFRKKYDNPNLLKKIIRYFRESGMLFFRKSGVIIDEGKLIKGTINLIIAFCLYPKFVLKRFLSLRKCDV